ncbi:MAG: acyl carrier protein [Anaerolineales bacterium]|nr:acyl carrier protein [Anaerolineales bacterium]
MTDAVIANLSHFIATHILRQPDRTLSADDKLISGGLIDSFHLIDLSLHVEKEFGVRLDDTELNAQTFDTLGELAALIEQRRTG